MNKDEITKVIEEYAKKVIEACNESQYEEENAKLIEDSQIPLGQSRKPKDRVDLGLGPSTIIEEYIPKKKE